MLPRRLYELPWLRQIRPFLLWDPGYLVAIDSPHHIIEIARVSIRKIAVKAQVLEIRIFCARSKEGCHDRLYNDVGKCVWKRTCSNMSAWCPLLHFLKRIRLYTVTFVDDYRIKAHRRIPTMESLSSPSFPRMTMKGNTSERDTGMAVYTYVLRKRGLGDHTLHKIAHGAGVSYLSIRALIQSPKRYRQGKVRPNLPHRFHTFEVYTGEQINDLPVKLGTLHSVCNK